MTYEAYMNQHSDLTKISLAYKNDPEYRKTLDANPKGIFINQEIPHGASEVEIVQNTDDTYYFVMRADHNQSIDDDDLDNIVAAAQYSVAGTINGGGLVLTKDGNFYVQYYGVDANFHHTVAYAQIDLPTDGSFHPGRYFNTDGSFRPSGAFYN